MTMYKVTLNTVFIGFVAFDDDDFSNIKDNINKIFNAMGFVSEGDYIGNVPSFANSIVDDYLVIFNTNIGLFCDPNSMYFYNPQNSGLDRIKANQKVDLNFIIFDIDSEIEKFMTTFIKQSEGGWSYIPLVEASTIDAMSCWHGYNIEEYTTPKEFLYFCSDYDESKFPGAIIDWWLSWGLINSFIFLLFAIPISGIFFTLSGQTIFRVVMTMWFAYIMVKRPYPFNKFEPKRWLNQL